MYVYIENKEKGTFEVGHYTPNGDWATACEYRIRAYAEMKVNYLNGGRYEKNSFSLILEDFESWCKDNV